MPETEPKSPTGHCDNPSAGQSILIRVERYSKEAVSREGRVARHIVLSSDPEICALLQELAGHIMSRESSEYAHCKRTMRQPVSSNRKDP